MESTWFDSHGQHARSESYSMATSLLSLAENNNEHSDGPHGPHDDLQFFLIRKRKRKKNEKKKIKNKIKKIK